MTTFADLLAGIIADPLSTARRLVVADWLDEQGDGERAEFIRVQCDLNEMRPGPDEHRKASRLLERYRKGAPIRMKARTPATLLVREALLLRKHVQDWIPKVEGLAACVIEGKLLGRGIQTPPRGPGDMAELAIVHPAFRRGFVESVSCSEAMWIGSPCGRCSVLGYFLHTARDGRTCDECHGSGRVNAHGPSIVAAAPVTQVVLTGKEPYGYRDYYHWSRNTWGTTPDVLASELFKLLPDLGLSSNSQSMRGFTSRYAALAALSRAATAWARDKANLPALDWRGQ